MELGLCPRCATPYTTSEVTGYGILRGRSAERGGPLVEYACQGCGKRIRLVPHGEGRYAPPGQPPPEPVPDHERAPPWMREGAGPRRQARRAPPEPEPTPPPEAAAAEAEPEAEPEPLRIPVPEDEPPLGAREACELLGVEPHADRQAIERAFRERSKGCHPDKVAHLDADFQALAEAKFRRLKRARDLLVG